VVVGTPGGPDLDILHACLLRVRHADGSRIAHRQAAAPAAAGASVPRKWWASDVP
jgi:hypothetical protein